MVLFQRQCESEMMGERYWISGVQLGLLKVGDENLRGKTVEEIIDKQFIGNTHAFKSVIKIEE